MKLPDGVQDFKMEGPFTALCAWKPSYRGTLRKDHSYEQIHAGRYPGHSGI